MKVDITNGNFTPKKQELVEGVLFYFPCSFNDIQENLENGTTKYICTGNLGSMLRTFNQTYYDYEGNVTFELPSRLLF